MDNHNLLTDHQKFGIVEVEVEVLQGEENLLPPQGEQYENDADKTMGNDSVLDLEISDNEYHHSIFSNKPSKEYHLNHQDGWKEDLVQYVKNTEKQIMANLGAEDLSEKKTYKCNETGCAKIFRSRRGLNLHKTAHSDAKPFQCEETGCEKAFRRKDQLISHMNVHSSERLFTCVLDGCTKMFKRKSELSKHIRLHNNDRPFKCDQSGCMKTFKTNYGLKVHMSVHSNEKLFRCTHEGCGKVYHWKNLLDEHQRIHSLNKMVCDFPGCNTTFRWRSSYYKHMRTHKLATRFNCTVKNCDATFDNIDLLANHIDWHRENSPVCSNDNSNTNRNLSGNLNTRYPKRKSANKNEFSLKLESEMGDRLEQECNYTNFQEGSSEGNEVQENVERCSEYPTFAFVDVAKIKTEDLIADVKLECEDDD